MKHRSTHIFILLAALLAAAPQVSQELSALRNAASRHVKAAIINAFLDLQAGAAARPAPAVADAQLASCGAAEGQPAAKKSAGQSRPATQVEVHARREVPAEATEEVRADVAMLADPALELAAARAELPAQAFEFDLHDVKVMPGSELAMLTPPDAEIEEARAAAHREAAEVRRAAARLKRAERSKREAASVAWRFADGFKAEGALESDLRGQLEALRLLDAAVRQLAARPPAKPLKLRRAVRPAAAAPAPPARVNCPARQLACGPSIPETLFVGE